MQSEGAGTNFSLLRFTFLATPYRGLRILGCILEAATIDWRDGRNHRPRAN